MRSKLISISKVVTKTVVVACLVGSTAWANVAWANLNCRDAKIREGMDLMLNLQTQEAVAAFRQLEQNDPSFTAADFYVGVAQWTQAYHSEDKAGRDAGVSALNASVKKLKKQYAANPNNENKLLLTLAQAHTARIKLLEGQLMSAMKMARNAQEQAITLSSVFPEDADLKFILGIYQFYSASIPANMAWVSKLFAQKGDANLGRKWIEQAAMQSTVFSPDAARVLLQEINWSTPEVCRYAGIADQLVRTAPRNGQIALNQQGVLLYCGYPERAIEQADQFVASGAPISSSTREGLFDLRLRSLSQMGNVTALQQMQDSQSDSGNQILYALAEAYDMQQPTDRAKAQNAYQQVLSAGGSDPLLKKMAKLRLQYPAKRRPALSLGQSIALAPNVCS